MQQILKVQLILNQVKTSSQCEQELPLDSMTGKPRKLNATGGRVGFSDGGNEALLEQLYEKFLDLGLSPKDAADAARKEFEQRARKAGGGIAYLMGL
jgi:hypothetical protein